MAAEYFDTLLEMVNRWKALLLLISVPVSVLSTFSSCYGWHVHFSLCPALNLSHEIFPLFCVLFVWYNSVDAGYILFFFFFILMALLHEIFYKSLQMNTFIHQNVFLPFTALSPNTWLSTHLTSSAHEMRNILCDSPVNTAIISSYTLRAQTLEDCVVTGDRSLYILHYF
jgi:hypothetical protein